MAAPLPPIAVKERGKALLSRPTLNKDTAFSREERRLLGLDGLLPATVLTLEEQVAVELQKIRRKQDPLERYIGLAACRIATRHSSSADRIKQEEFLPSFTRRRLACKSCSQIWRSARALGSHKCQDRSTE